jgi:hypothetical protein
MNSEWINRELLGAARAGLSTLNGVGIYVGGRITLLQTAIRNAQHRSDILDYAEHEITQAFADIESRHSPDFDCVVIPAHDWRWLKRRVLHPTQDDCSRCEGKRGGVPGNENIVKGKVLCDYCSADEPGE